MWDCVLELGNLHISFLAVQWPFKHWPYIQMIMDFQFVNGMKAEAWDCFRFSTIDCWKGGLNSRLTHVLSSTHIIWNLHFQGTEYMTLLFFRAAIAKRSSRVTWHARVQLLLPANQKLPLSLEERGLLWDTGVNPIAPRGDKSVPSSLIARVTEIGLWFCFCSIQ